MSFYSYRVTIIIFELYLNVYATNHYMISLFLGNKKVYLNSDNIYKVDANINNMDDLYIKFFNKIKLSGLSNHELKLKIGVSVILLRNIDKSFGYCNSTRLIVTKLEENIIKASVLSCENVGQKNFIIRLLIIQGCHSNVEEDNFHYYLLCDYN